MIKNIIKNLTRPLFQEEFNELNNKISLLENKDNNSLINPLEEELNSKYPKKDLTYKKIEVDRAYQIALQNFFQVRDFNLPTILGATDDEIALNSLRWIIKNIKYVDDKTQYGYDEYWAFPYQTFYRKMGDCEDGAILLANIMVRSGIPYYKVRITAGDVDDNKGNRGGHCFVVYYCESKDKWVILDWCYWADENTKIENRKDYKDENYYKSIWFSWNQYYSFTNETFKTSVNNKNMLRRK